MGYKWARWLPDALKAEGCRVQLEAGWSSRGRYRLDGRTDLPPNWDFEPNGLFVWHHTAGKPTASNPWPSKGVLIRGRADLPGPLCQLSPDPTGLVHVVAAGRANHAGTMSGRGPTTAGSDGNTVSIGCEIEASGYSRYPSAQYLAAIRCAAAVNRHFGRKASWSLGHAETSVTGKWDPGADGKTVSLSAWRKDLAECLSYPPGAWRSPQGASSWGEVSLANLRAGGQEATVKRLQYRIKRANPGKVPAALRSAVQVSGKWDAATVAAVAAWQKNVFAPSTAGGADGYQGGRRLGSHQADMLFGSRYHLVP